MYSQCLILSCGIEGTQGSSPQAAFASISSAEAQSLTQPEHPATAANSFKRNARWKITTHFWKAKLKGEDRFIHHNNTIGFFLQFVIYDGYVQIIKMYSQDTCTGILNPNWWYFQTCCSKYQRKTLVFDFNFADPQNKTYVLHNIIENLLPLRASSFSFLTFNTTSVIFCNRKFCVLSRLIDSIKVSSPFGFSAK